jgi:hypothetical protein
MDLQKYAVNQYLIDSLLAWVREGQIAIPEIQRPFVWSATKVRDLMDSLYQGYPIGYIITWKNPDVRLKDGSLANGKMILIDGQQRITALQAAMVGQQVLNKDYKKIHIRIAFNPKTETFEVQNPAISKSKEWIPDIAPVLQEEIGLLKLVKQYGSDNPDMSEEDLETVFQKLKNITKRQIGVIQLEANLDIETVTEIFIRINSKGVVLSQADFVMSKIAANETHGGNTLRKAIDYFCHLAVEPSFHAQICDNDSEFAATDFFQKMEWLKDENDDLYDPTYADMLRVAFYSQFSRARLNELVALLSGRNFETREYEIEIEEESYAKLKEGVIQFARETNFQRFLMIIRSTGFIVSRQIRAQAPINFCYAMFLKLRQLEVPSADIEHLVRRWFVLSVLSGRYSASPETVAESDIKRVDKNFGQYLSDIEEAELSEAFWNVGLVQSLTTSSTNSLVFNAFLASQVKLKHRGFLSHSITVENILTHQGDVHHIYPKDYLKKQGLSRTMYNQVANLVYMQTETNIAISNSPPPEYFSRAVRQCESKKPDLGAIIDRDDLERNLSENAIPVEVLNGTLMDYNEFLERRRKLIAQKMRLYYESL